MAATATMVIDWVVPLGESRALTQVLHQIMVAARGRAGCVRCSVSTNAGRHVRVRYEEEWADVELLQRELRSDRFSTLAALMERGTTEPIVDFVLPGGHKGLEYVEEVRAMGGH
jgi:quinol monooxygenase YgiN